MENKISESPVLKYVKYEDMMDAVMDGKDEGLEAIIMEFIEDFE